MGAFGIGLRMRLPIGDDRLRPGKGDRSEAGSLHFGGKRVLSPALAIAQQDAFLAHRLTASRVSRIEGDTEQVSAEVARGRGIRFPQAGLSSPQPHLTEFSDGKGPCRGGPGDRTQGRSHMTTAGAEQTFRLPALARRVAGYLAAVADRERLAGEISHRSAGLRCDR